MYRATLAGLLLLTTLAAPPAALAEETDDGAETEDRAKTEDSVAPRVVFATSKGDVVVELTPERTPGTVENFLAYVDAGHYDGTIVYRIESFLIQAGSTLPDLSRRQTREPIQNEAADGLKNMRGTIGMARYGPHTATAEFYINLRDNPHLDHREKTEQGYGYTVFGRVVDGMDVVDAIAKIPTERRGNLHRLPKEQILIKNVDRAPEGHQAAPAETKPSPESDEPTSGVRVEGTLTTAGVECPVMRGDDGKVYSLAGSIGDLQAGDEIWVEGEIAQMSICMQGTTINVKKIGRKEKPTNVMQPE